jgi:hypothetical protein
MVCMWLDLQEGETYFQAIFEDAQMGKIQGFYLDIQ